MAGPRDRPGVEPDYLDLAVRAYAVRETPTRGGARRTRRSKSAERRIPAHFLVFDTETTTDPSQRLVFGSWRYYRTEGTGPNDLQLICVQEGIFYPDDLAEWDPDGAAALNTYAKARPLAGVDSAAPDVGRYVVFCTQREFLDMILWRAAYRLRAGVVCFNSPFDLSRLAWRVGQTRNRGRGSDAFAGGFSLALWYHDKDGERAESRHRPRLAIKTIDSKRALKGFRAPEHIDAPDLTPDDGTGKPDPKFRYRGEFLDLRTLTFALTDRGHTLESACKAFDVPYTKREVEHGTITPEYIDYCREDVEATAKLCQASLREFLRHPIDLPATRAFSPATLGRGYLKAMGITPPRERQTFDDQVTGYAMSAYYGGRSECLIRRTPVPVVYCDFASMYPTVCALTGAWRLLIAEHINAVDATNEVQQLLDGLTLNAVLDPELWTRLLGIAQIVPDGDIVPVRAQYTTSPSYQIGVNPLHSDHPMWSTIADLAASKLLTGNTPKVLRGIRFEPHGITPGLRPVRLRGDVEINPATNDFFIAIVEARRHAEHKGETELAKGLKVLANATSYGIYAQMTRHELGGDCKERVTVYGARDQPWTWTVPAPEDPGEYCFPPLAATITGGARLMLALTERLVTDFGGAYAFCDTDSMAIVATRHGSLVPCLGGQLRTPDGQPAIKALSWRQVDDIRRRFKHLNPYDPEAVPGSILELEDENYTNQSLRKRRQLWCHAISAKRYVLYNHEPAREPQTRVSGQPARLTHRPHKDDGEPTMRKPSEHGLGHLLNPTDPDSDDRGWIKQTWNWLLRTTLGLTANEPPWLDTPAIARHSVSTPHTLRLFQHFNADRIYGDQIKPYNFLNIAFVHPIERSADEQRIVLVAPYEPTPKRWSEQTWVNRYSGGEYRITTAPSRGRVTAGLMTVRTHRDLLGDFATHPEAKSLGPDSKPCGCSTVGLLGRRPVRLNTLTHIGKETNRLDDVQSGLVTDPDEVVASYDNRAYELFRARVAPVLRTLGVRETARRTGHSVGAVSAALRGEAVPRPRQIATYVDVAVVYAKSDLLRRNVEPATGPADCLRQLLDLLHSR